MHPATIDLHLQRIAAHLHHGEPLGITRAEFTALAALAGLRPDVQPGPDDHYYGHRLVIIPDAWSSAPWRPTRVLTEVRLVSWGPALDGYGTITVDGHTQPAGGTTVTP